MIPEFVYPNLTSPALLTFVWIALSVLIFGGLKQSISLIVWNIFRQTIAQRDCNSQVLSSRKLHPVYCMC